MYVWARRRAWVWVLVCVSARHYNLNNNFDYVCAECGVVDGNKLYAVKFVCKLLNSSINNKYVCVLLMGLRSHSLVWTYNDNNASPICTSTSANYHTLAEIDGELLPWVINEVCFWGAIKLGVNFAILVLGRAPVFCYSRFKPLLFAFSLAKSTCFRAAVEHRRMSYCKHSL